MNQELQKQIASLVESANKAGVDLVTFIQQQSPDLFTQLVRYQLANALIGMTFAFIPVAIGIVIWRRCDKCEDMSDSVPGRFFALLALILGSAFFFCGATTVVQCLVSPKIVAIKQIAELTK